MLDIHKRATILIGLAFSLFLAACAGANLPGPQMDQATQSASASPIQTTAPVAPQSTNPTVSANAVSSAAATPIATTAPVGAVPTLQAPVTVAADGPPRACTPGALTPAETEGPYYKENPPEDASLVSEGMPGTTLKITGYVFDANCRPIAGTRVDFWQADSEGQYDNTGYTLRGYQLTDARGRYSVQTVVPGIYPGRTRHIHVKVTPPNGAALTTQLFFPDEPLNRSDRIFIEQNVLSIQGGADGEVATFNFVVERG